MLLFLLLPSAVSSFFFPQSSGCSCGCAPPPVCPPIPTCAIPGPCPEYASSTGWTSGVPAIPAIPAIPAQPALPAPVVATSYIPAYSESLQVMSTGCSPPTITAGCSSGIVPAVAVAVPPPPPPPAYLSTPQSGYVASIITPQSQVPVAPAVDVEDRIIEVVAQQTYAPTLIPPVVQPAVVAKSYDDTAPPPPLPVPAPPVPEYKTSDAYLPAAEYQSAYAPREQYEEGTGIHSGSTPDYTKLGRKVSTEGFMEPLNTLNRRNLILKRMRNVRTMGATIPHTNATCNSNKLANVMARAIVPDVSVAKRMVMRSAELAFDGAKFDVFCATGEFSYSIHSRKYCEVTRDEVTCFAFR